MSKGSPARGYISFSTPTPFTTTMQYIHTLALELTNTSLQLPVDYFYESENSNIPGKYITVPNYSLPENATCLLDLPFDIAYPLLKSKIQSEENSLKQYLNSNSELSFQSLSSSLTDTLHDSNLIYIVYFHLGCIYLREVFSEGISHTHSDYPKLFSLKAASNLIEAHNCFTKSVEFLFSNETNFDNISLLYLHGYTSFMLHNNGESNKLAVSALSSLIDIVSYRHYYCLDYCREAICSLYMLCMLTNCSPASVTQLQALVLKCKQIKTHLLRSDYLLAQELTIDPSNPKYNLFLFFKLLFNDSTPEAVNFLKETLKSFPNVYDYYHYLHFLTKDSLYRTLGNDYISTHFDNIERLSPWLVDNIWIEDCNSIHPFSSTIKILAQKEPYLCCQQAIESIPTLASSIFIHGYNDSALQS